MRAFYLMLSVVVLVSFCFAGAGCKSKEKSAWDKKKEQMEKSMKEAEEAVRNIVEEHE